MGSGRDSLLLTMDRPSGSTSCEKPEQKGRCSFEPINRNRCWRFGHARHISNRANGVWASVHSFAADGAGSDSADPYLRIISLFNDGAAGIEVMVYLIITAYLGVLYFGTY